MVKKKEKELNSMLMETNTKEILCQEKEMETELVIFIMETNMKDNGEMGRDTVKVLKQMQKVNKLKEYGSMMKGLNAIFSE